MKLHKYLTLFIGLFVGLNAILFVVFQKYYFLLLHHTIFYCQEMARTLAIRLPGNSGVVVFSLLSAILLATVIKFVVTAIGIYTLRKNLMDNITENSLLTQLSKKLNVQSRVLVVNSLNPFALCFGIRRPKIYISTKLIKMLSIRELEVVLLHEKYHLENRDTQTLMLATIFESLLPFFPLISDFIRQYRIERELSADGAASEAVEGNKHLSTALAKLLRFNLKPAYIRVPAIADIDTLETRIKRLTNKSYSSRQFRLRNILVSFTTVGFLLLLALMPVHAFELHSEERDIMMVCTQGQSCESTCRDSGARVLQSSNALYSSATTLP